MPSLGSYLTAGPPTSEPSSEMSHISQGEYLVGPGNIAAEIENALNITGLSRSAEVDNQHLGERYGPRRYIKDLRLECVTGSVVLSAHETIKLVIFGRETEKGRTVLLEWVTSGMWKQTSIARLPKDIKELGIVVTFRDWVNLSHVWFTQDELWLSLESHEARIDKKFPSGGATPALKVSFSVTDNPQEGVTGDAISRNESVEIARGLCICALESYLRFLGTGDLADINQAVSAQQLAVRLTPTGDGEKPESLNVLGKLFLSRFEHAGNPLDVSEAISLHQQAVQFTSDDDAEMPGRLGNLGNSFLRRFEHTAAPADISEAISNHRRAVQLTPNGHDQLPSQLNNLGVSLMFRFECSSDPSDMSEAISLQKHAIELTPNGHTSTAKLLNNLGIAFTARFERDGDLRDISEAISLQHRAVQLTPEGGADKPSWMNNLGLALMRRFERTGNLSDISEAISFHQRALEITPVDHANVPGWQNNLGLSLMHRFQSTGDIDDISKAVTVQQQGVYPTPNGDALMPLQLSSLGVSFAQRFERTGDLSDITEAISCQKKAVQLTPDGHTDLPSRLSHLGLSLMHHFERTGNVQNLSEAISFQQQAIKLTPDGHSRLPSWLDVLGISFMRRFECNGDLDDMSEAIDLQQRAVDLSPNDHASKSRWLTNLGTSLMCRFKHAHNPLDIAQAISIQQQAILLTPDGHANMPWLLVNLSVSFLGRFKHTNDINDLSEAIALQQKAIRLTPIGHSRMPLQLHNLCRSFMYRFQHTGDLSDIGEATLFQQRAVELTPDGHAELSGLLCDLATSYLLRFEHTGDLHDVQQALSIYEKSTVTPGPPSQRLSSARRWAQLSITHDPPSCLKAFEIAIDLISQVAGMHHTIKQRHSQLVGISSLTTAGAATAFALGEFERALEWLEQGRCLVWGQLNQLRTPVDELREHDEDLALRFSNISGALESSVYRGGLGDLGLHVPIAHKMSLQEEAHTHLQLSLEWIELLDEIRNIPRFHDFLRPPRAPELLKNLPHDGPIIIINIHESRCDALALVPDSDRPVHIPLDNFTHKQALNLKEHLHKFLLSKRVRVREVYRAGRPVQSHNAEPSDIHFVLKELWAHVVKPILNGLAYSHDLPSKFGRIWWCPTGPLAFLPLHAAGEYNQDERPSPQSCISAFAVSSYTPTVRTLLEKLKIFSDARRNSSSRLLIISQPKTPGCTPIPGTTKELRIIAKTIGLDKGKPLRLEGKAATVNRVKLEMEAHGSVHFACHASQNFENPLKSGFFLHDGRLELADIMMQKVDHRELAFLSACQTSTGDEKLSEEAVHLAAGMLAVGYRSVVATMWSINDTYGPMVAEGFYKYLVHEGRTLSGKVQLDSARSAYGLHHAIQSTREQVGDSEEGLLLWVPYVHFGL